MPEFPDHAQLANIGLIEELYNRYLKDPESVEPSWRHFFEGIDFAAHLYKTGGDGSHELVQTFRRYGHLWANFNPLESAEAFDAKRFSALDAPTVAKLKEVYCGAIGYEYMDLGKPELEKWIQERIETQGQAQLSVEEKHLLLDYLNRSEVFEAFLHTKYVGQTRFSLEGAETVVPLLAEMIDQSGAEEVLIGMAHRGRLNILTNILNRPLESMFAEFEDDTHLSFTGSDDVRYHMGFVGKFKNVIVEMAANPSHLESIDPVVLGQVFAKQKGNKQRVMPLLIHGDASVAGQGVVYESLQLMNLPSYSVGGTIHLVINNQIGYTTLPSEGRSTRYCTDIAKTFGCPVFHVNAEDPESCLFVGKLAVEIRQKFGCDVFIDLLCYRKYGHNEGDEPSYTQPLHYQRIRSKKSIGQIYREKLQAEGKFQPEKLNVEFKETLQKGLVSGQQKTPPAKTDRKTDLFAPCETAVAPAVLKEVLATYCKVPEGFHLHPKLQKWVSDRLTGAAIDWATGECLAFGSLLKQGVPVRLAGQDSQRGTFSQRHLIWVDVETGEPYCPLCQYKAKLEVVNSPLTEFAGMGFEYGYSWAAPTSLVLWEAQYGDFNNGAEVIIDQYIVSAEQKWNALSSLVLLLPHGYEGAGPEHSSARMERFLQLAADNNIQVVNPSTPAQYFHLLRKQALRTTKKPLIVFTPKSLLRSPACTSQIDSFTSGTFEEVLDDPAPPKNPKRLILCSGKVFYDLLALRKDVALVRIEQLYPLNQEKLKKLLEKYPVERFWVQEEPENMGAWNYIQRVIPNLKYVGRPASATTATGSNKKHKQEQAALLQAALL